MSWVLTKKYYLFLLPITHKADYWLLLTSMHLKYKVMYLYHTSAFVLV